MTPIKKTGSFHGKSNALGGGGRFAQLVAQGKSPALAAYIGRKSLGKAKFQKLAAAGHKGHHAGMSAVAKKYM